MQTVFQGVGWEGIKWPMLTSFFFILIIYFFGNWLMDLLCEYFPNLKIGDVEINEEIENYWKTLDEEDRKWSLREEENARNALKTKILTDDQFEALKSSTQTMYFVEKFMLFYGHVMPPMYDERLSNDVLSKLQFAPILYLMFGYWMASN